MGKSRAERNTSEPEAQARVTRSALGPFAERLAFFILLLLIAMRPMLDEKYDSSLHSIERATGVSANATPATTATFDLLIWVAGILTAASIPYTKRWKWTGAELGWLLLIAAAVISTLATSNKRLAANASVDWLTTAAMMFMLVNLTRARWQIALVLTVILASGLASAAKSAMQVGIEFQDLSAQYLENKEEFWKNQNMPLDDPRVELFERRMAAKQAMGFFPYSNAQAAFLSLSGFAALALIGFHRKGMRIILLLLALLLFSTILITGSLGGVLSAAAGIVLWFACRFIRKRYRPNWRNVLLFGWGIIIGASLAVVCFGSLRGSLPGASLAFRWNYWQVTAEIIRNHFWTGVGALNFNRAYLALKPITYPEEIKDPHNFILSIIAQWGALGGIGLLLLLVGASNVFLTKPPLTKGGLGGSERGKSHLSFILLLIPAFLIFRLILKRQFLFSAQPGEQALVFFDIGLYCLLWLGAVGFFIWTLKQDDEGTTNPARIACFAGSIAFLLHNTIEFAMFYPGTLTPFIALAAMLFTNGAQQNQPTTSRALRPLPLVICIAAFATTYAFVFRPVIPAAHHLAQARTASNLPQAEARYHSAAKADRLDPTPLVELAAILAQGQTLEQLNKAVSAINEAATRDPNDLGITQMKIQIHEARYQSSRATADLQKAITAARRAVDLYPESPEGHVRLAEILAQAAGELNEADLSAEAISRFQRALQLDAARPIGEIRRWPESWRDGIQNRIDTLTASLVTSPAE